jgi:cation diffusion facilitator CzcD-associated flavoprotein CzcO
MNQYNLGQYCRTSHKVVGARWHDEKACWQLDVEDLTSQRVFHDECDILINASGILNHWRWPAIPGLDNYRGKLVHSADWDDSINLEGANVGLIGNG